MVQMNAHVRMNEADAVAQGAAAGVSARPVSTPEIPDDRRMSQPAIIGSLMLSDAAVLLAFGLVAAAVTPAVSYGWPVVGLICVTVTAAALVLMQRFWTYTIASIGNFAQQVARVTGALFATFSVLTTLMVLVGLEIGWARDWLVLWSATALGGMSALRYGMARMVTRWTAEGRLARRAVIVGGGKPVEDLLAALSRDGSKAIQILGLFDDRGGERSPDEVNEYHKLGKFDELVDFCREHAVDLLIITLPHTAETRILQLLKKLWVLPIDIRISAIGSKLKLRPRAYTYIGKTPFLAVFDKPLTDWGLAVKNVEDRLLAGIILVMLAPVMLAVALAVKFTSKGPIFFKQTRYGFNNEKIGVYKFRSMYVDQCDAQAVKLVTKGDPRVTRVGAFIRKTSLDELPQLINVLKGELSIVGPRPHAMQAKADGHIYDEVVEGYFARHKVKPGITGWAQINGWRGETDTVDKIERRVEYDLQYIDNWSVFFDLYILAMTPVSLLNTKNAY